MLTVKALVKGEGKDYEHIRLNMQTEGFKNGAKVAENQTSAYLDDFNKFLSDDEKLLAEAEAAYNAHTLIATGDECKKSMAEAHAFLIKAQGHLAAIKATAVDGDKSIQSLHETATKAKADIDLIREEKPATKEARGKRVEAAEALCKEAQKASKKAAELLALAKQKASVERPLFLSALKNHSSEEDNMYFHLRNAKAIQEQTVSPRLKQEQAAIIKKQTEERNAYWTTQKIDTMIQSLGIKCLDITQEETAKHITDMTHSMLETEKSFFPGANALTDREKTYRVLLIKFRFNAAALEEARKAMEEQNLAANPASSSDTAAFFVPLQQAQANAAINAAATANNNPASILTNHAAPTI